MSYPEAPFLSRTELPLQNMRTIGGRRRDRRAPEGLAAVPVGGGRARPGFETMHRTMHQRPGATGVEGAGGTGGPGCGARGRWRGLAGLRDDAPSNISDQAPLV